MVQLARGESATICPQRTSRTQRQPGQFGSPSGGVCWKQTCRKRRLVKEAEAMMRQDTERPNNDLLTRAFRDF